MAFSVLTATIPAGSNISSAINLAQSFPVRLTMPVAFEGGSLTFQSSPDGITFRDLFDGWTGEIVMKVTPNTVVLMGTERYGLSNAYIKLRAGTRDNPVIQSADRTFLVMTDTSPAK